jgi:hypothetical protein
MCIPVYDAGGLAEDAVLAVEWRDPVLRTDRLLRRCFLDRVMAVFTGRRGWGEGVVT